MDLIIHFKDKSYDLYGSNMSFVEVHATGTEIMNSNPSVTHYTAKPSAKH